MITSGAASTAAAGLFGKLPARGDFVQLGLPGSFVRPWDAWLQQVMAASQQRMGAAWLAAYLESPVWRFVLPGGMCGAGAVLGLLMPSVDRVGRYYPLTLAAVFSPGAGVPRSDDAEAWLEDCETAGRAALDEDVAPDELIRRLPQLRAADPAKAPTSAEWWTIGGPRVPATRLALAALPDAAQFEAMLEACPGTPLERGRADPSEAVVGDALGTGLGDARETGPGDGFAARSEAGFADRFGTGLEAGLAHKSASNPAEGLRTELGDGLGPGLGDLLADNSESSLPDGLGIGLGDGLGTGFADGFAGSSEAEFSDGLGIGLGNGLGDGSADGDKTGQAAAHGAAQGAGAPAQEDA